MTIWKIVLFTVGLIALTVATQFYGPRCYPGTGTLIGSSLKIADCYDKRFDPSLEHFDSSFDEPHAADNGRLHVAR